MSNIGEIALQIICVRDQLKFYHWAGTNSYSRHIASDGLVDSLTEKLDKFIHKYVLCTGCSYPELRMQVEGKEQLFSVCNSCGKKN